MYSEGRNIVVAVRDVKRQTNSYGCGIFALAFAYSLAAGQDPSQLTYKNSRAHVEECLVSGTVSPFPSRVTHRSRDVIHSLNEEVYCFCRGIDNNTLMVMCDSCEQWFSHHPHSHHRSLLLSFTPGSKPTFSTNPSHLRFLLPTGLPHDNGTGLDLLRSSFYF